MDFLEIRKKARERAAASHAPDPAPQAPPPGGADPAPPAPPADALERELAARLQGLPPADARFTTWRPGTGEPPHVEAPAVPASEPRAWPPSEPAGAEPGAHAARGTGAPPPAPAQPADPLAAFFYREDEEAPDVAVGGLADGARAESADTIVREEYLTFLLAGEEYAVAIERVREVLKAPPITEVPRAPAHVCGVVTVRGEVVAVFDPRRRLGLPGAPPPEGVGRVVIVDAGGGPCGLLVDAVASVVRLRPGTIEPCPQGIGGAAADCLAGIGRHGERLFTVLDLGALFRRAPAAPRRAGEEGGRARA
jgi:purine-binding chemotaxis protein CheW